MTSATLTCTSSQGAAIRADLFSFLTAELAEIARADADAWIKSLRAAPYDGRTMRERFTYRGDSLWWFTELYLQRMRRLETATATMVALGAACDRHAPAAVTIETDDLVIRDAAHTYGRARGVPIETRGGPVDRLRHARPSYLAGLAATLSRLRPASPPVLPARTAVAVFVHTAVTRPRALEAGGRGRSFIAQIVETLGERVGRDQVQCVGVGRRRNLRRRATATGAGAPWPAVTPIERFAPPGALTHALDLWRRRSDLAQLIITGDGIREAARVRQYDLWPVLRRELEAVALLQWPWAARAMDEAAAAIGAIKPQLVVASADASAWGRAIVLEARRRDVPSIGLQHELMAEHGAAYSHEPDELAATGHDHGFPLPDRLLVFDHQAARRLDEIGHVPASRIVVTGHPRMDALRMAHLTRLSDAERAGVRRRLGVQPAQKLAVLVARVETLGPLLPAILAAAAGRPGIHVAIKTHPADMPGVFESMAGGLPNVGVVPADFELAQMVAAADGLITHESTVAVDALSIGVPTLVVGRPDHLGPLVDAGIMLEAAEADAVPAALDTLLNDDGFRRRLSRVVSATTPGNARQNAARTVDRAVDAILSLKQDT